MNINDRRTVSNNSCIEQPAARTASPVMCDSNAVSTKPSDRQNAPIIGAVTGQGTSTTSSPLVPGLAPPMLVAPNISSRGDVHEAMDKEKADLVAELVRGGTLSDAVRGAMRIAEMHGKPRHADEVCAMAGRLIDDDETREAVKLAASLVVLGEWASPAKVILGGRLNEEEKRAHIFPINGRAAIVLRQIEGGEPLAQAIEGASSKGVTPWLHAVRDISAMDAPRKWRQDAAHPDGRLSLEEIGTELEKNDARPGRNPEVTAEVLTRYAVRRNS